MHETLNNARPVRTSTKSSALSCLTLSAISRSSCLTTWLDSWVTSAMAPYMFSNQNIVVSSLYAYGRRLESYLCRFGACEGNALRVMLRLYQR